MSQVSPGWYPDPSGRFVQRYHDGTRWTEHVADANGNRATDMPETQARPASYQQGGYGQQGPERRYDRQAGGGWDPRHVGEAAGAWPAATQAPGPTGVGSRPPAGAAGAGPRTGAAPGHDVRQGYGPQPGYGQPAYGQPNRADGAPPSASAGRFTPTLGLIVGVVGGLLVLLSLFGLDFLEFSFPGFSETISLADVAGDFNEDAPFAIDTYASFGRFLAVVVIVGAVLAPLRVIPLFEEVPVPIIVAAVCGAFALWHVLAMLSSAEGVDVSPTFGAILGLLGYVGLAAGPFLKQPLGAARAAAVEH